MAVYFILLILGVVNNIMLLFVDDHKKDPGSMQILGHLICIAVACLLAFYVGRSWYHFRLTGGLHGNLPKE